MAASRGRSQEESGLGFLCVIQWDRQGTVLKATDLTYLVIDVDQPEEIELDLESWLADLLVDYWLRQQGGSDAG